MPNGVMGSSATPFWNDQRCRQHGWWLLLVLALMLYLPGTATIPLMDRDEPRFAHATVEMMERDTWTIPYFNGAYRFDKPPLTYWWMRLHYALLGVNELAARLHSIVAVYSTALVVAGMARKLTQNATSGLVAGVAWLTSLQSLVHGRLCVADMPMILLVALACRALVELLTEPPPQRWNGWFWCLWLSLGAGFLAKGPIAWFVPALALVLWRWVFWKKPLPWSRLQAVPGLCIAVSMVAAWGVPALIETNGAFWKTGMGEHVVKRGTDVFNGRKFVPGFYLLTTWLSLFPWMGFALPVWRSMRANWTAQTSFLAAWFLAPQLIFFFYATQLPHYVMPGYPAFFVLLALAWHNRRHEVPALAKWLTLALAALVAGGWVFVSAMQIQQGGIQNLLYSALLVLTCVLAVGGAVVCVVWKQGMTRRNGWLVCVTVILTSLSLALLGEQLRATSVPVRVAAQLGTLPADMTLHGCGYTEPSLVFYTNHLWQFTDDVSAAKVLLQQTGPVAVVVLKREWTLDRWFKGLLGTAPQGVAAKDHTAMVDEAESTGVQSQKIEGFNVARFSWVEVQLLIKR
ncbi:MAG: glycosyltransferase family 39 protein [Prosthecobacter sp.]|uniref:ArnT family glycosyltransferase n=1 Tax=Prosthecobacter sp. TaxID=1965333 RepID=UPI0025EDD6EF|nr:glycosyltransferase family 39 protein [Prosthecobacter sp.]MCF7787954.1 glycosyltransferase family 39 protein [Prosthecobacter sp.]